MNRKEFLARFSATAAAVVLARDIGWAQDQKPAVSVAPAVAPSNPSAGKETALDKKYEFSQSYIKRFMDVIDKELTPEQRVALMRANGRACYLGSHPKADITLDEFIHRAKNVWHAPEDMIRREGDTVYFRYVQNSRGLRTEDGYCLCPLVEQGPPGLSGTYCECSVGYVGEMFSQLAGKPVKVELTESLKRGGKACRFTIHL